jgi:diacylglycerol kinase (ATP)
MRPRRPVPAHRDIPRPRGGLGWRPRYSLSTDVWSEGADVSRSEAERVLKHPRFNTSIVADARLEQPLFVVEAIATFVVARRLIRRNRSTSALTMIFAWVGSFIPRLGTRARRRHAPPGVAFAWAAARISPAARLPVASGTAIWTALWGRKQANSPRGTWLAMIAALGGAALGGAIAERAASGSRAVSGRGERRLVAIVVNRHSGSARLARRAVRSLRREGVVVLFEEHTTGSGLQSALSRASKALPPEGRLVVAGGDGTIGQATAFAADARRALAILPTGTGNDVARSLGLSMHPEQAAAFAAWGQTVDMDLGQAGEERFAHALTLGMTAEFADAVQNIHGWRRPLFYPIKAWEVWRRRGQLDIAVRIDGVDLAMVSPPFQLAVVNAPRLGGRLGVSLPGASPRDGYLHVIAVYRGALRRTLSALVDPFRTGVENAPAGALLGAGQQVEVSSGRAYPCALDGERNGHTPLAIRVIPEALQVVVPSLSHHLGPAER